MRNERKQISIEIVKKWLKDGNWCVRTAAMNSCKGRDIPIEIIEKGLNDDDSDIREAAMNACQSIDIPIEIIEKGLKDSNWRVREAAMNACKHNNIPFPIIRTIEPPDTVYKKCINDVIVCASIPKDAQVRGEYGKKCRASAAVITGVIGDVCGEPVGISMYDKTTTYYAGDEIVVDDFDMRNEECSTGFHFFCSLEEAKKS